MNVYEKNYKKINQLIPDLETLNPGDARVSKSGGFMDLHLDILDKNEKEMRIALHHAFTQNGDLVSDPDMEIKVYLIDGWPMAEALTFQDQFGYRVVYPEKNMVDMAAKRELNSFLNQWLTNCIDQGHKLEN